MSTISNVNKTDVNEAQGESINDVDSTKFDSGVSDFSSMIETRNSALSNDKTQHLSISADSNQQEPIRDDNKLIDYVATAFVLLIGILLSIILILSITNYSKKRRKNMCCNFFTKNKRKFM